MIPRTSYPRVVEQVRESASAEERKGVHVSSADEHDLVGSKGTAHFVIKVRQAFVM